MNRISMTLAACIVAGVLAPAGSVDADRFAPTVSTRALEVAAPTSGLQTGSALAGGPITVPVQSLANVATSKTVAAYCPSGTRVVGGGGDTATANGFITEGLALTQLEPVSRHDGVRDAYVVTAAKSGSVPVGAWKVRAYATCADPATLPGLQIVPSAPTAQSSTPVQATSAVCPAGHRVIGTGGRISTPIGQVALQVVRPSDPGDIARVQAHEDADGYAGLWNVISFAVCARTPAGYDVVFAQSTQKLSESRKYTSAACPPGMHAYGAGAALSNLAPGHVALQGILPDYLSPGSERTYAVAGENTPTSQNWDFIVATAVCVAL